MKALEQVLIIKERWPPPPTETAQTRKFFLLLIVNCYKHLL